jgi:nitrogen fixation-related uncharacterized protein
MKKLWRLAQTVGLVTVAIVGYLYLWAVKADTEDSREYHESLDPYTK